MLETEIYNNFFLRPEEVQRTPDLHNRRPSLNAIRKFFFNLKLSDEFSSPSWMLKHVLIKLNNDMDYKRVFAHKSYFIFNFYMKLTKWFRFLTLRPHFSLPAYNTAWAPCLFALLKLITLLLLSLITRSLVCWSNVSNKVPKINLSVSPISDEVVINLDDGKHLLNLNSINPIDHSDWITLNRMIIVEMVGIMMVSPTFSWKIAPRQILSKKTGMHTPQYPLSLTSLSKI
ncbi:hypothetical protein IEQ34_022451 [Dendrobium chrysotoxum]|uniref:Uncharacterized protein n=1 Tax=Dendrobium chrysotoxum TaxID=161865 RepID=A0AAV7FX51_DENCH|nr:hypothetical protein IEQ34_022451 [Dendrobium chrysotoxum]